jgi:hypothetical protein
MLLHIDTWSFSRSAHHTGGADTSNLSPNRMESRHRAVRNEQAIEQSIHRRPHHDGRP